MKRNIAAFVVCLGVVAVLVGGCASAMSPATGFLYTKASAPMTVTSVVPDGELKSGEGSVTSILGLIATGDASIETIASAAGITKIHHVDYSTSSLLGLFAKFTVKVYGQ